MYIRYIYFEPTIRGIILDYEERTSKGKVIVGTAEGGASHFRTSTGSPTLNPSRSDVNPKRGALWNSSTS